MCITSVLSLIKILNGGSSDQNAWLVVKTPETRSEVGTKVAKHPQLEVVAKREVARTRRVQCIAFSSQLRTLSWQKVATLTV